MIQNIHEIRPERQLEFLGERELFEEGRVPLGNNAGPKRELGADCRKYKVAARQTPLD